MTITRDREDKKMKKKNMVSMEQYTLIKLVFWSVLGVPFGVILGIIGIVLSYIASSQIVSRVYTVADDDLLRKKGVSAKAKKTIFWVTVIILSLIFCLGMMYLRGGIEYLSVILAYMLSKHFVDSFFYVTEG